MSSLPDPFSSPDKVDMLVFFHPAGHMDRISLGGVDLAVLRVGEDLGPGLAHRQGVGHVDLVRGPDHDPAGVIPSVFTLQLRYHLCMQNSILEVFQTTYALLYEPMTKKYGLLNENGIDNIHFHIKR